LKKKKCCNFGLFMRIRGTYQKGVLQRLKTGRQKQVLPYAYCGNNPMNRIDPTGMGDYYTREGYWLGFDEIDDDKVYGNKELLDRST
jgi:hypothetical protein